MPGGFAKSFVKFSEKMSEMVGDTNVHTFSEDFIQNDNAVNATEDAIKELRSSFAELLQPNASSRAKFSTSSGVASKLTGSSSNTRFPQAESIVAGKMEKHATVIDSYTQDSIVSVILRECATSYHHIGEQRDDQDYAIKQNVFEPWNTFLDTQVKEVKETKKKLDGRRLYYDAQRKKQEKNPAKLASTDVEHAKGQVEETLRQCDACMDAILCNDTDRVAQLKAFIDAQLAFHKNSYQVLEELSRNISSKIAAAPPKPTKTTMAQLKPTANTTFTQSSFMNNSPSNNNFSNDFNNNSSSPQAAPRSSSSGFQDQFDQVAIDPWSVQPQITQSSNSVTYAVPPASSQTSDPFGLGLDTNPLPLVPTQSIKSYTTPVAPARQTKSQPSCRAIYDFEPENPGELGFKAEDVIELVTRIDDNWFEGRIYGKTGYFPVNYVTVITPL